MARVSSEGSTQIYEPPSLPEYLKNVFDLKPVVGVPSDEEVKGIHAVIRAAYNVSHVPGMFDPTLSMHLAQHLFEVQMAKYRAKYPLGMVLGDTVYTPPALPPHVPITLNPVVGAPSDEEMKDVQAAARSYEHFANVPSMFDPQVSMELSQHLVNIQIARYMQNIALGQTSIQRVQPRSESTLALVPVHRAREPLESPRDNVGAETPVPQPPTRAKDILVHSKDNTRLAEPSELKPLLEKLVGTMENVNRVLIATQRSFVRGARTSHNHTASGWTYGAAGSYEMINDKGERPTDYGLPPISRDGNFKWNLDAKYVDDVQLALYLQFYGVGGDLVENGDVPALKEGKRPDAEAILLRYLD